MIYPEDYEYTEMYANRDLYVSVNKDEVNFQIVRYQKKKPLTVVENINIRDQDLEQFVLWLIDHMKARNINTNLLLKKLQT